MTGKAHFSPSSLTFRALLIALAVALGTMVGVPPTRAQIGDTGTISGAVTDPSGAMVPKAQITITNVGTGIERKVVTDSNGNYITNVLPFGRYTVTAEATGFTKTVSKVVILNVGGEVRVNLTLAIGTASESVVITGTLTTVDTDSTMLGTTFDANQISNLPINGRDISDFLEIAPGSINSTGFFQGSINGLDNIFTGLNIKLDGQNASRGDINGFLQTEGDEQARITRASVDSVQEIDFSNNGYNGESGFSLGPQMNIITKAGTNDYHGEVFEYFRNDALDAKDFFENSTTLPTAPLRMNQFGGNVAGPIIKRKVFFFANYEGVRQRITSINALNETPSAYVRSLFVPAMQPVLNQLAPLPAGCTTIPAPVSCAVPSTTDTANPAGGADLVYDPAALPTTLREDTGSIRVDYHISDQDTLMGRYNINDSLTTKTLGLNLNQVAPESLRTQFGKLDETHAFSTTFYNEFSVNINRFYSNTNSDTGYPLTGFSGFFVNLGSLPTPNTFNQITPFANVEILDSVTKTKGNHTVRFGAQIRINRLNEWLRPQQTFEFGSFSDLENDRPFVLSKIGFPGFVGIRDSNWHFYVQDDWKITPRLTVNLALRYEYNTPWTEGNGKIQNFDVATQSFFPQGETYNAPAADFAPRIGISWDPFGRGKTVIHAYGGIFYLPMQIGFGLVTNIPAYESYSVNAFQAPLAYPEATPPLPAGTQNVVAFPRNPHDPYSTNWLLSVQQEVAKNTVLTVNYTGNKTQHMQAGVNYAAEQANPQNFSTDIRPFTGFASENVDADALSSNYNALQVQLRRNSGPLVLEANYTWSHEIDDTVNVFSNFSDPMDPSVDRGSGDWDVRNNLTASAVYSFPQLKDSGLFVREALGGWQASSILQVRSGLPANITLESGFFGLPIRPDVVSGQPLLVSNPHWPDASFNINAYEIEPGYNGQWGQILGDVGRNSVRGPGFAQWDMSVMKNFPLRERLTLQFRADLFNILNHPNFFNPDGGICTAILGSTCVPNANFGRVGQTVADGIGSQIGTGTARQAQLSLKLMF